ADGDRRTRAEVPRPADDLLGLGIADVDLAELEPVGVGVRVGSEHAADDEMAEVAVEVADADLDHPLDLERRDGEAARDLRGRRCGLDVLAQPGERDAHQNCPEKRRSLRQSSRRSGNSWRSIAMRSSPHPNAKPEYRSGSYPTNSKSAGSTIPAPPT